MAKKDLYDASSIQVLEGLEGVRKKPQFYLGTATDELGLFQLAKELVDNCADEAQNGFGNVVGLAIQKDWVYVWDEGRGIPVEVHPSFKKEKTSTLEIIFTRLHAGGKISDKQTGYKKSRGTHGVGSAVVNALTEALEVYTFRQNKWHEQTFSKGVATSKVKTVDKPPKIEGIKTPKCGTVVRYKADTTIFKKYKLSTKNLAAWFDLQSYIHAKINFILAVDGKVTTYYQPDGLVGFLTNKIDKLKLEAMGKPFVLHGDSVDLALQWSSYPDEDATSYINGSPTAQGGTHVQGLNKAIADALKPHAGARSQKYRAEDLRSGMLACINYSTKSPEFDSQAKTKFVSKDAKDIAYKEIFPALKKFFETNKSLAKDIIARANEVREAQAGLAMSKAKAAEINTNKKGKVLLPSKMASCLKCPAKQRELFLVEGDSAGGSAKLARNTSYQEVLPLKGKPPNAYRTKPEKFYANEEVMNILKAIGYNPSSPNPLEKIRVGKIIILTDADPDGDHISLLLTAFFEKVTPKLLEAGIIFTVDAPLFTAQIGSKRIYGETLKDVQRQIPNNKKIAVTRIKGWGEINPQTLEPVAFDPKTRKLVRLKQVTGKRLKKFLAVVGAETDFRKSLLGLSAKE